MHLWYRYVQILYVSEVPSGWKELYYKVRTSLDYEIAKCVLWVDAKIRIFSHTVRIQNLSNYCEQNQYDFAVLVSPQNFFHSVDIVISLFF